jgi:hypothetical protein
MTSSRRFELRELAPGALMLDLRFGGLYELNESAAFVWRRHLAGESAERIADGMASRYGLDRLTALEHAEAILAEPVPEASTAPSDYLYERDEDGYLFSFQGRRVFRIDDAAWELTTERTDLEGTSLRFLVRAVAPKLLALKGQTVLHASAVEMRGAVVAFCGISGAGKTSTARAFAEAGAALVAEDQLLVQTTGSGVMASVTSERAVEDWVSEATASLAGSGRASFAPLESVVHGEYRPLREIGFLDRARRTGYETMALDPVRTAGSTFRNAFFGSDAADRWIDHLEIAASVGQDVVGLELSLPDGLADLATTARRLHAGGSLRVR